MMKAGQRSFSPSRTGSPFRNVLQSHAVDGIEAKLVQLMKDYKAKVTVPIGTKVQSLMKSYSKNKCSSPQDRTTVETLVQRNVSFMSNVERVLNEAMHAGVSVEVSVVQRAERMWRDCNDQNVQLKLFLGIDGETTQLYGLKAKQKMRAERAAVLSSPARSRPVQQHQIRSPLRTRSPAAPPSSIDDIPRPNKDLPLVPPKRSPLRQRPAVIASPSDPMIDQTAELIRSGRANVGDIKECHRIFKDQHGTSHGNSRFVSWLSQFPSSTLEGLLDGFWVQ